MLGDSVKRALEMAGITEDRARRWLGDCCCEERRERLNQLDTTCRQVLKGRIDGAKKYLERLLGDAR